MPKVSYVGKKIEKMLSPEEFENFLELYHKSKLYGSREAPTPSDPYQKRAVYKKTRIKQEILEEDKQLYFANTSMSRWRKHWARNSHLCPTSTVLCRLGRMYIKLGSLQPRKVYEVPEIVPKIIPEITEEKVVKKKGWFAERLS